MSQPPKLDPIIGRMNAEIATSGVYVMIYLAENHDAIARLRANWRGPAASFWRSLAEKFAAANPAIVGMRGKPLGGAALEKAWQRHIETRARAAAAVHQPSPTPAPEIETDTPPSFVGIGKPKGEPS